MAVTIDKAGQHRLAAEIDNTGTKTCAGSHIRFAADRENPPALDRNSFDHRHGGIHRADLTATIDSGTGQSRTRPAVWADTNGRCRKSQRRGGTRKLVSRPGPRQAERGQHSGCQCRTGTKEPPAAQIFTLWRIGIPHIRRAAGTVAAMAVWIVE